ncbi:MAG: accessory Sec system protein Asp2 [Lachnospiraceae bacterium]|nr:accessory Sec system protein Asp2 [Lachnospiraceae bacterium]
MSDINVLFFGKKENIAGYEIPEDAGFDIMTGAADREGLADAYEVVILDKTPESEDVSVLWKLTATGGLFVTENVYVYGEILRFFTSKKGRILQKDDIPGFLKNDLKLFYKKGYGEKYQLNSITVSPGYKGSVSFIGNCSVILEGDYGDTLKQIVCFRNNIPIHKGQCSDILLEYRKDDSVELSMEVMLFKEGSISQVLHTWVFNDTELDDIVLIENEYAKGTLFFSLLAKGSGKLEIISLNNRYSRKEYGYFLPGGDRYETSSREELFCYFDPGDLKPPLNVYFAGYKKMQSFEGYSFIRKLGCPFLLISESRVEGGCFYMGDEEYEQMVLSAIRDYMDRLCFTPDDVIFSGLSMGSFGAMYYGADILPHAVILGKPLASIGNVAANERLLRPGGFPTSLDVLLKLEGGCDGDAIERLNRRFWDKFEKTVWGDTKFIVAYMIEDDYDQTAYEDILSHLDGVNVKVYGKGLHGRHNDNTRGIVSWFSSRFRMIINEDFGRGDK